MMKRTGLVPRLFDKEALTREERLEIAAIGGKGAIIKALRMSANTVEQVMDPCGRLRPHTLDRIRARLAELRDARKAC